MSYVKMTIQKQQIENEIANLRAQLKNLPDGKLIISHNETRYKWYHKIDGQKIYISKSNQAFAEQLAYKKYLEARLEDLYCQQNAVNAYLKNLPSTPGKAEQLLTQPSGYQNLLSPHFLPSAQYLQNWVNEPYPKNEAYPEHLIHQTPSGKPVRSKSEAIISLILSQNQIPFRYEAALVIGNKSIYPDFTILHPQTCELYYWEHFGMMDDLNYCKTTCAKLHLYISNGIIPSIQLITTYETSMQPLSSSDVEEIVNHYFL